MWISPANASSSALRTSRVPDFGMKPRAEMERLYHAGTVVLARQQNDGRRRIMLAYIGECRKAIATRQGEIEQGQSEIGMPLEAIRRLKKMASRASFRSMLRSASGMGA
jgi:hypothetical protein